MKGLGKSGLGSLPHLGAAPRQAVLWVQQRLLKALADSGEHSERHPHLLLVTGTSLPAAPLSINNPLKLAVTRGGGAKIPTPEPVEGVRQSGPKDLYLQERMG